LSTASANAPSRAAYGPTDGNGYQRIGPGDTITQTDGTLQTTRFEITKTSLSAHATYDTLDEYKLAQEPNEGHGRLGDPNFRHFTGAAGTAESDDLRLQEEGAANQRGPLPLDLLLIDARAIGPLALLTRQVRGCHPRKSFARFGSDRLKVGVNGNQLFPR
jgi:hypothetical protein